MASLPNPVLEQREFDAIPVWTDDALEAACGVRIAFTGRAGGTSAGPYGTLNLGGHVGDDRETVVRNRRLLLDALGATSCGLVVPTQVHGTDILFADAKNPVEDERMDAIEADGVVVRERGLAVQLSFADCLPLMLVAPDGAFAVAHAGWRGALAGIAGKAARALAEAAGSDASGINAYIGPHIRSECFETGVDVAESFAAEYGNGVLADERHVDLSQAVAIDLGRAGVSSARIADCGICTVCRSEEYFSYRASGGKCGRNGAVAFRI